MGGHGSAFFKVSEIYKVGKGWLKILFRCGRSGCYETTKGMIDSLSFSLCVSKPFLLVFFARCIVPPHPFDFMPIWLDEKPDFLCNDDSPLSCCIFGGLSGLGHRRSPSCSGADGNIYCGNIDKSQSVLHTNQWSTLPIPKLLLCLGMSLICWTTPL